MANKLVGQNYQTPDLVAKVTGRAKYVRKSFLTSVLDSGTHWASRPIVPNVLADGVDLFSVR